MHFITKESVSPQSPNKNISPQWGHTARKPRILKYPFCDYSKCHALNNNTFISTSMFLYGGCSHHKGLDIWQCIVGIQNLFLTLWGKWIKVSSSFAQAKHFLQADNLLRCALLTGSVYESHTFHCNQRGQPTGVPDFIAICSESYLTLSSNKLSQIRVFLENIIVDIGLSKLVLIIVEHWDWL